MSASERNFANFRPGDNVYELADGLIPEMAERLDVKLASEPNAADLQQLMGKVGINKVTRLNAEITAIDRLTQVSMIERAGLQNAINRSLHDPERPATAENVDAIVMISCMANWQEEAADAVPDDLKGKPVYLLGGNRVMDTPTEVINPSVAELEAGYWRYPTETEFAGAVILPRLVARGFNVLPLSYDTGKADEMFAGMLNDIPHLRERRFAVVRNANPGITTGFQLREQGQAIDENFDADPDNPQVYVITPSKELAPTPAHDAPEHSRQYQKVGTAMRPIVLTGLKAHQAAGGE
jgi:hypothetical protein